MKAQDKYHIYLGIVLVIISALTCIQTNTCIAQNSHTTLTAMNSSSVIE